MVILSSLGFCIHKHLEFCKQKCHQWWQSLISDSYHALRHHRQDCFAVKWSISFREDIWNNFSIGPYVKICLAVNLEFLICIKIWNYYKKNMLKPSNYHVQLISIKVILLEKKHWINLMSHMLIYMSCNRGHIWILFNNKNVKFVHDYIKNIPAKFAYKRFNGFIEEDKRVVMTLPHLS